MGYQLGLLTGQEVQYIATYFAVRNNSSRNAAIWAINLEDCLVNSKLYMKESIEKYGRDMAKTQDDFYYSYGVELSYKLTKDIELQKNWQALDDYQRKNSNYNITLDIIARFIFNNIDHIKEKSKRVVSVYPYKLNKRMLTQQAIFLCPVDITTSFIENIRGMYDRLEKYGIKSSPITKIIIPRNIFGEIAKELDRFNINGYSLFPDKAGLSGWFTETFIPNKAKSAYPFKPSHSEINFTENINRLFQSIIHMDMLIPNQLGSIGNILYIFKYWNVNIEHLTFIAFDQYIDRIMIDGSVPWQKESFIVNADKKMQAKENIDIFDKVVRNGIESRQHDKSSQEKYISAWTAIKINYLDKNIGVEHLISKINRSGSIDNVYYKIITDYVRFLIKEEFKFITCGSLSKETCRYYGQCNERYCLKEDKNICNYTFNRVKKGLSLSGKKS